MQKAFGCQLCFLKKAAGVLHAFESAERIQPPIGGRVAKRFKVTSLTLFTGIHFLFVKGVQR